MAAVRRPAPGFNCRHLYSHSVINNRVEDQRLRELGNDCYSLVIVLLRNAVRRLTVRQKDHDLDSDYDPIRSLITLNALTTP